MKLIRSCVKSLQERLEKKRSLPNVKKLITDTTPATRLLSAKYAAQWWTLMVLARSTGITAQNAFQAFT